MAFDLRNVIKNTVKATWTLMLCSFGSTQLSLNCAYVAWSILHCAYAYLELHCTQCNHWAQKVLGLSETYNGKNTVKYITPVHHNHDKTNTHLSDVMRKLHASDKWCIGFALCCHPRYRGDDAFTRCVCLCVSVYVCHDVCPDDLTMKDWCHTNKILQAHSWRCLVVQVLFHALMTWLMTSVGHKSS